MTEKLNIEIKTAFKKAKNCEEKIKVLKKEIESMEAERNKCLKPIYNLPVKQFKFDGKLLTIKQDTWTVKGEEECNYFIQESSVLDLDES